MSLHVAAGAGDIDTVCALLDDGKNDGVDVVNAMDSDRRTALHLACAAGFYEVADILLRRGADPNSADVNDETALQRACEHGHADVAELLLDWRAHINWLGLFRMSPLHYAGTNVAVLETLLNRGANIEIVDHNGLTVLHWAAKQGEVDLATLLLDCGANVDARDHDGLAPLRYAADVVIVDLLLRHGADVDARDRWGRTALWHAVDRRRADFVAHLLRHAPGLDGTLHRAVAHRDANLATALLDAGAGPEEPDDDGELPLHRATRKRDPTIIRLLVARGAHVDGPTLNAGAQTALQLAALDGDVEMCALLLAEGAGASTRDAHGRTALHAAAAGHVEVVRLLLDHGAGVDMQDNWHWTPLAVAADGGWLAVARLLVARGAALDAGAGTMSLRARLRLDVDGDDDGGDGDDTFDDGDGTGGGMEIDGRSPLFRAAAAGFADIVALLLDHGSKPDEPDMWGWRAIHKAAQLGHASVVKVRGSVAA